MSDLPHLHPEVLQSTPHTLVAMSEFWSRAGGTVSQAKQATDCEEPYRNAPFCTPQAVFLKTKVGVLPSNLQRVVALRSLLRVCERLNGDTERLMDPGEGGVQDGLEDYVCMHALGFVCMCVWFVRHIP